MTAVTADSELTYDPAPNFAGVDKFVVVESTDQFSARASWRNFVAQKWAEILVPTTVGIPSAHGAYADSAWFRISLDQLAQCRKTQSAEVGPNNIWLETAEYLIGNFAVWPSDRRPDMVLDPLGRPNFAAKSAGYYFHLSIEDDATLNWLAIVNGQEVFSEEDHLKDAALSSQLSALASM